MIKPPEEQLADKIFSVCEYLDFLNDIITPQKAIIQGEIGQLEKRKGYDFFTLLDKKEQAALRCFVWQRTVESWGIELEEGMELQIEGFPNIYKRTGSFNFEVERLGLIGEGSLKLAFEKMKVKLAKLGYFSQERKRPIPQYVDRIGLITSNFGDAKNDFLTHLGKFGFKIFLYDVRVEGLYAIDDVTAAIKWFNENVLGVEVLVITRGGGSLESLQTFNSEAVAKAIFSSKIPIITGIGHENDETIADLVADFYASTPTHSARVLSDPWRQAGTFLVNSQRSIISIFSSLHHHFQQQLFESFDNLITASQKSTRNKRLQLDLSKRLLESQFQKLLFEIKKIQLKFFYNFDRLKNLSLKIREDLFFQEKSILRESKRWFEILQSGINEAEQRLSLANPEVRLKQGYSIILSKSGKIIKSYLQIKPGDELELKFSQGKAQSKVETVSN